MSKLWAEIWSRPGDSSYGRLIDDPQAVEGTLHDTLNGIGDGTLKIPASFDRFDEILNIDLGTPANSATSTVKIFSDDSPTTPLFEWFPNKLYPTTTKDDPKVRVDGVGRNALLAHARLEPYDWDGSDDFAPLDPDWQFGGGRNLLQNPGFEVTPMPNGSFEDGNTGYWQATEAGPSGDIFDDASLVAVDDPANADSGDFYGQITSVDGPDAGALRSISGLTEGKTYTITGKMDEPTASGDRFRAGISDASTATHTNAYEEDGYWWAEVDNATQGNGASDGTWQTFTLTFVATGPTADLVIVYADPGAGPDFRIDTWAMTGEGVGLFPWYPHTAAFIDTFEHDTTVVHSGTGSVKVQSTDFVYTSPYTGLQGWARTGPAQTVSITPGKTYTASAWIRQDSGSDKTFILLLQRTTLEGTIGTPGSSWMSGKRVVVPSGTWTKVTLTDVADTSEVQFEVRWEYQGAFDSSGHQSPVYYVDDTVLYEGLPATTVGEILRRIYEHAINPSLRTSLICWDDGSTTDTPYLTLDFSDTVDSNGNAWDTDELITKLTLRQSYSQIMANLVRQFGYEYRIVPNNVETGTYLWQVYNPGTMETDYTSAASPAIQGGASDIRRGLNRFVPQGSDTMVEGLGRVTARARNTALMSAMGRIEASVLDRDAPDLSAAASAASSSMSQALTDGDSYSYTLAGSIQDQPLVDYVLGDLLTIDDPPEVSTSARLVDVTATFTSRSTEWEVQFGSAVTLAPEAAVASAVSGLLSKFEYPDQDTVGVAFGGGGAGGAFTVQIASSSGPEIERDKADLVAVGTSDDTVIQSAVDLIHSNSTNGGTIWLGGGDFNVDVGSIDLGIGITLRGSSQFRTRLVVTGTSGTVIEKGAGSRVEHLSIIGPGSNTVLGVKGGVRGSVSDVVFNGVNQCIEPNNIFLVENCQVEVSGPLFIADNGGYESVTIRGCVQVGQIDVGSGAYWTLDGNSSSLSITADGATNLSIPSHTFDQASAVNDALLELTNVDGFVIGTIMARETNGWDGALFDTCSEGVIGKIEIGGSDQGLTVDTCANLRFGEVLVGADDYCGEHGIEVVDSTDVTFGGATIINPGQNTDDTYDGLLVTGGSRVRARDVVVISTLTTSPQPRYGINFASGSGHSYLDCEVYTAANFASGAYSNAAGATNTWPAAGGAQGDNLL